MPTVRSWVHKGAFPVVDGQQQVIINPFQATGAANALANSLRSSVVHDVMSKLFKRNHMETTAGFFTRTCFEKVVYNFTEGKMAFSFIEQHFSVRPGDSDDKLH